jgi:uncharacterized membrane protein YqhA
MPGCALRHARPSASDIASQVVAELPTPVSAPTMPSANEVANQVIAQFPAISVVDIALIAAIVVVVVLLMYVIFSIRKLQK